MKAKIDGIDAGDGCRSALENYSASTPNPAPGFRDAGNDGRLGALYRIGHSGYSWSTAVSGTNGMLLNFYVTWLNPSNANSRGYGFQLRCLSE